MIRKAILFTGVFLIAIASMVSNSVAGSPYALDRPFPQCARGLSDPKPQCAFEITCTDKPVQLGYSDGVCFRASCPGIWVLLHKRVDQASFRQRVWTYRHYTFKGYWQLKDQGAIQSGPAQLREMFLLAITHNLLIVLFLF